MMCILNILFHNARLYLKQNNERTPRRNLFCNQLQLQRLKIFVSIILALEVDT